MSIIEQIKVEIERLKSNMDDRDPLAPNQKAGYLFALADVLSFISTLESEHLADASKTSPNELEEAAKEYAKTAFKKPHSDNPDEEVTIVEPDKYAGFIAGAKWDKEQIMKNAKDGWIDEECVIVLNDGTRVDLQPDYEKNPAFEFEYAQDVQVIVLPKEDSHDTRRKE